MGNDDPVGQARVKLGQLLRCRVRADSTVRRGITPSPGNTGLVKRVGIPLVGAGAVSCVPVIEEQGQKPFVLYKAKLWGAPRQRKRLKPYRPEQELKGSTASVVLQSGWE